jgi:hypothetical protein
VPYFILQRDLLWQDRVEMQLIRREKNDHPATFYKNPWQEEEVACLTTHSGRLDRLSLWLQTAESSLVDRFEIRT